ncbi:MAG: lipoprotein LipL21 [Leptospiraceae bacterium]|nr:lipoprotein LipL21 [Leptospiraceae bacterium]
MKRLSWIAILIPLMMAMSCGGGDARRDATTVGASGWIFEGWACAPDSSEALKGNSPAEYCDDVDEEDKDYLYMKFSARASSRAIRENSIAMKQSTCRDAALTQVKGDGLSKIVGDYLEQASGVSDGQSTGVAIIRQSQGKIRGIGLYDCCSLNPSTGRCAESDEPETWEECQCVGYLRYPGGRDAFKADAQETGADVGDL